MSLKENLEMVKDELNSEEKFFEKAVMTERFVKKYKKPLIGVVVVIFFIVVANLAYQASEQHRIESANETLALLQKNPNDKNALAKLKSLSPVLHDVWLYSLAVKKEDADMLKKLTKTEALIVNDAALYEAAQNSEDLQALEAYSEKEGAIYKDLALLMSATLLIKEGEIQKAHDKLKMISKSSPFSKRVDVLMHYGVK